MAHSVKYQNEMLSDQGEMQFFQDVLYAMLQKKRKTSVNQTVVHANFGASTTLIRTKFKTKKPMKS